MPRDGAIIFGDLIGRLVVLVVACEKCGRSGRYSVGRLIEQRGPNGKIIDWKDALTADCPRKIANNMTDQCAARCPDLPELGARRGPDKRWEQRLSRRGGLHRLGLKLEEYERYIDTDHWQKVRDLKLTDQAKERGYNYCERCGERAPTDATRETAFHVHHKTYERLGEERLEDLEIICRRCHEKEHQHDAKSRGRHYRPGERD
jgi:5-methylcytosine-specific restriction endonuclease McrA